MVPLGTRPRRTVDAVANASTAIRTAHPDGQQPPTATGLDTALML